MNSPVVSHYILSKKGLAYNSTAAATTSDQQSQVRFYQSNIRLSQVRVSSWQSFCLVKLRPACLFEQNALTYILITQCSFLECIYLSASSEYSDCCEACFDFEAVLLHFRSSSCVNRRQPSYVAVDCFHRRNANQMFVCVLESDISGGLRGRDLSG